MGSWNTKPWDNDCAADWYGDLFDKTQLREEVVKALSQDVQSFYEDIRAAAMVLVFLGRTYVWPIKHLDSDLALAISKLKELKPIWKGSPGITRELEHEIAVLESYLNSQYRLPDTEDFQNWWLSIVENSPSPFNAKQITAMAPQLCEELARELPRLLEARKVMESVEDKISQFLIDEGLTRKAAHRQDIREALIQEMIRRARYGRQE